MIYDLVFVICGFALGYVLANKKTPMRIRLEKEVYEILAQGGFDLLKNLEIVLKKNRQA